MLMVISSDTVGIVLVKEDGRRKSRGNASSLTCYLRLTSLQDRHEECYQLLASKCIIRDQEYSVPRTFKPFYGWWIVVVSAITLLLSGGIGYYSFGAFFTPLIDEFGWSRAQISLSMSKWV